MLVSLFLQFLMPRAKLSTDQWICNEDIFAFYVVYIYISKLVCIHKKHNKQFHIYK